jgi:hypothetical protein
MAYIMDYKEQDNSNLIVKLELRRYFLRLYHGQNDPPDVFDACQGDGVLWRTLRREFDLAGYWGVDEKHKRGRLKLNSADVLANSGWEQNVIDIDTYGSPWEHWFNMLPHVHKPITAFLTIGVGGRWRRLGPQERDVLGLEGLKYMKVMAGTVTHPLLLKATSYCLGKAMEYPLNIVECSEAVAGNSPGATHGTRYVGVRLEPA